MISFISCQCKIIANSNFEHKLSSEDLLIGVAEIQPGRGATRVNHVVIRKQKNAGKGLFIYLFVLIYLGVANQCTGTVLPWHPVGFFFTYHRGLHLGYEFHEIFEKRYTFKQSYNCHLMYKFQRHEILL